MIGISLLAVGSTAGWPPTSFRGTAGRGMSEMKQQEASDDATQVDHDAAGLTLEYHHGQTQEGPELPASLVHAPDSFPSLDRGEFAAEVVQERPSPLAKTKRVRQVQAQPGGGGGGGGGGGDVVPPAKRQRRRSPAASGCRLCLADEAKFPQGWRCPCSRTTLIACEECCLLSASSSAGHLRAHIEFDAEGPGVSCKVTVSDPALWEKKSKQTRLCVCGQPYASSASFPLDALIGRRGAVVPAATHECPCGYSTVDEAEFTAHCGGAPNCARVKCPECRRVLASTSGACSDADLAAVLVLHYETECEALNCPCGCLEKRAWLEIAQRCERSPLVVWRKEALRLEERAARAEANFLENRRISLSKNRRAH